MISNLAIPLVFYRFGEWAQEIRLLSPDHFSSGGAHETNQLPRGQLPPDQLPPRSTPMKSTPTRSTSHEINSCEVNSHQINFPRDQIPWNQLPPDQLPTRSTPVRSTPTRSMNELWQCLSQCGVKRFTTSLKCPTYNLVINHCHIWWELTLWELTLWELTAWELI